jgi:Chaperone of endosialidase
MRNLLIFLFTTACISTTYAQIAISSDGSAPHSSAVLDVKSTTKAFYPPRMTTAEKEGIVGKQVGAVVFDITLNQLSVYNGSAWVAAGGTSFTLPFSGTSNASNNLLYIENTAPITNFSTIYGKTNSSSNIAGIYGLAASTASTNNTAGVRGQNNSANSFGYGVEGIHTGTGIGGYFSSANGTGASLSSTNGFGLKTQGKLQFGGNGVGTILPNKFLRSININGEAQWSDLLPYSFTTNNNSQDLLKIENTATTGNFNAIAGTINSQSGAAISGYAKHPSPTSKTAGIAGYNEVNDFNIQNTFGVYGYTVKGEAAVYGEAIYGNGTVGDSQNGYGIVGNSYYSDGVKASSHDGNGIFASSTVGTAGYFQGSNIGFALKTDGKVRIGGNNVGALGPDKLLKSINNNGDAEWADFLPFSGTTYTNQHQVSFKITNNNYDIPSNPIIGETTTRFNGTGILGLCSNASPVTNTIGVQGSNNSTNNFGYGVYGLHGGGGIGGYFTSVTGKGISGNSTSGIGGFFESNGGKALITGLGNVGIGVTEPAYILDINKRVRIRHTVDLSPDDNTAGIWYNNSANVEGAFSGMKTDTEVGLFLGGNWRFWVNSGGQGYLNGALIQTSDKRLKKDFSLLNNSLSNIYKINGYHYFWKNKDRSQDLQTGLIAQEVQKIFPELVQTDEKGFLSVNYIGLIPHLLEAVKELKNENDSLKTENNSFKSSQIKLESRIDKMETLLNSISKNTASN